MDGLIWPVKSGLFRRRSRKTCRRWRGENTGLAEAQAPAHEHRETKFVNLKKYEKHEAFSFHSRTSVRHRGHGNGAIMDRRGYCDRFDAAGKPRHEHYKHLPFERGSLPTGPTPFKLFPIRSAAQMTARRICRSATTVIPVQLANTYPERNGTTARPV